MCAYTYSFTPTLVAQTLALASARLVLPRTRPGTPARTMEGI
jgi:hypothetical protein